MSLPDMLTETCSILRRPATVDAHGQKSSAFAVVASDVACQRGKPRDGRLGTRAQEMTADIGFVIDTIYFIPGVDVRATDRIQIGAMTYAVDGVTTNGRYTAALAHAVE